MSSLSDRFRQVDFALQQNVTASSFSSNLQQRSPTFRDLASVRKSSDTFVNIPLSKSPPASPVQLKLHCEAVCLPLFYAVSSCRMHTSRPAAVPPSYSPVLRTELL